VAYTVIDYILLVDMTIRWKVLSFLLLDLQKFNKGNNGQLTDGQEIDGEVVSPMKDEKNDKTESTPSQKNDRLGKLDREKSWAAVTQTSS